LQSESEDEAHSGRISPLRMAAKMKQSPTPEKDTVLATAERSASSLNGKAKQFSSLNGR